MAYKNLVKYRIDLRTVFNRVFQNKEVRNALYPYISDSTIKRAYGLAVIDEIVKRTQVKKIDKDGDSFETYSKSYAKSLNGQIYGKNAGSIADLTMTGEMLSSMDVQNAGKTQLFIKFVDEFDAAKAHGHIHGIKRNDVAGHKVIRDFFGLPQEVEDKILKDLISGKSKEESLLRLEISNQLSSKQTTEEPGQEINMEIGFD
jgi:hypothetical protein